MIQKNKFRTLRKTITLEDVVYMLVWLAAVLALIELLYQIGVMIYA